MKASFDGARRNLARAYNDVAEYLNDSTVLDIELQNRMGSLQAAVGGLLAMYDPNCDDDANEIDIDLIDVSV